MSQSGSTTRHRWVQKQCEKHCESEDFSRCFFLLHRKFLLHKKSRIAATFDFHKNIRYFFKIRNVNSGKRNNATIPTNTAMAIGATTD